LNLRVPGPTPIPPSVQEATGKQMINHRGPEFRDLINSTTADVKKVFSTKNDVLILTSSGTGGLEAAITNILTPGERTIVVTIGEFGDRVVKMCETFGAQVVKVAFQAGQPADPAALRQALRSEPQVNTVFITHNETSTGVTNDLASLSAVVKKEFNKLLVVDGISSISSIPCLVDEWEIDIAISGSQKGWMTPPGLAMLSVSPRAWETIKKSKMPRFYFDLPAAADQLKNGMTPWTPAVSVLYALQEGARILVKEGMDNVYKKHAQLAGIVREGVKAQGLQLFAKPGYESNTVTAIVVPPDVQWNTLNQLLLKDYQVALAGGQGPLSGKVFRIGHMGYVNEKDLVDALGALKAAIAKLRAAK
jgi:aspartate aminotransferase-like enzyme